MKTDAVAITGGTGMTAWNFATDDIMAYAIGAATLVLLCIRIALSIREYRRK